jgi:hypothetical protein
LNDLKSFFEEFDRHTLFVILPMLAIPFILDKIFSLQPPWPRGSTYITTFLELAAIFVCYFIPIKSRRTLLRIQFGLFGTATFLFVAYFVLYSMFVFTNPFNGDALIAGYECTEEAQRFVAPLLNQQCPFLTEEALAAAQYEVEQVWTPVSVRVTEIMMFLSWSMFFIVTTFLFGLSVAFMQRNRKLDSRSRTRNRRR